MSHYLDKPNLGALIALYDQMTSLYSRGLELGELAIHCKEEKLSKIVDERNRIFNRIGSIQEKTEAMVEGLSPLSPSMLARIEESKNIIRDMLPRFQNQLFKMNKNFIPKLRSKRTEVVSTNKKSRAAMAYLKAPGSFQRRY